MKKTLINEYYQVIGYNEYYDIVDNSPFTGDENLAEKEAEKYIESGKYHSVIIRKSFDWECSEVE